MLYAPIVLLGFCIASGMVLAALMMHAVIGISRKLRRRPQPHFASWYEEKIKAPKYPTKE